jgi:hypothetical protein
LGQRIGIIICARFAAALHKPFQCAKPIEARHLNIKENEVGMVLLDEVYRFDAVRTLRYDINTADGVKKVLEFVAGQLFVVDDEG